MAKKFRYLNREISWLAFNDRVLQEAEDERVPLIERLRFLGIFSNNRDEFFRVRVATLKRMAVLHQSDKEKLGFSPDKVLEDIQKVVVRQEKKFNQLYKTIVSKLDEKNIHFLNEDQLDERQTEFVEDYFHEKIRPSLVPIMLEKKRDFPQLKDRVIYLAVKMRDQDNDKKPFYALIEFPPTLSRFVILPQRESKKYIMLLDDLIRKHLKDIFSIFDPNSLEAYTFKITLDAELDVDSDFSMSWIDKIASSVKNRKYGQIVRFVYDKKMPEDLLKFITKALNFNEVNSLIASGRYHNFRDFIGFPDIGAKNLRYKKLPPVEHPVLKNKASLFEAIKEDDVMLNYPYQSFNYVIDLLREAAIDPSVKSIRINLYRVASVSKIINALINAAKNGKRVIAVVELQARFDEENNIHWSNHLQEEGVQVIFGVPGLKVHSKLILIKRSEGQKSRYYAHIGTGNFHEGTAEIYGDTALLTADQSITKEVKKVFEFFQNNFLRARFSSLSVSPFNTRRKIVTAINQEIKNAKAGKKAFIVIKLNNITDEILINKLYDASNQGVKIDMIIRGICCLIPGVKGMSENIRVISIVDRFLEHSRILWFHNAGEDSFWISSADWMERNLDKRVEVSTPIRNPNLKIILQKMLEIQLSDNVKARNIDSRYTNNYIETSGRKIQSQLELHKYFSLKSGKDTED